jgi:hypothetical protein
LIGRKEKMSAVSAAPDRGCGAELAEAFGADLEDVAGVDREESS